jgi:hypothetical protein
MARSTEDQQEPAGFAGPELLAPIVELAKYVYDAVRERRHAVLPTAPLTFGVADSVTSLSGHSLKLDCSNLGAHGVYVEDVVVLDPVDVEVKFKETAREQEIAPFDFGTESVPPVRLPILVPAGGSVILVVPISPFSTVRMKEKPFGKLSISYTVLGAAKAGLKHEVEFSVRRPAG